MHLIDLYKSFFDYKVRYLLCGGLAINMYGIPRSTADMDIILDLDETNIRNFLKSVEAFGYQSALPISILELVDETNRRKLREEKGLIAFSFFSSIFSMVTLDVLVDVPVDFDQLWQNKSERKTKDTSIFLVSVEDLVVLKTHSNRLQDRLDIDSLKKIFPEKFS